MRMEPRVKIGAWRGESFGGSFHQIEKVHKSGRVPSSPGNIAPWPPSAQADGSAGRSRMTLADTAMTRHLGKVDVVHQRSCPDIATGLDAADVQRNLRLAEARIAEHAGRMITGVGKQGVPGAGTHRTSRLRRVHRGEHRRSASHRQADLSGTLRQGFRQRSRGNLRMAARPGSRGIPVPCGHGGKTRASWPPKACPRKVSAPTGPSLPAAKSSIAVSPAARFPITKTCSASRLSQRIEPAAKNHHGRIRSITTTGNASTSCSTAGWTAPTSNMPTAPDWSPNPR